MGLACFKKGRAKKRYEDSGSTNRHNIHIKEGNNPITHNISQVVMPRGMHTSLDFTLEEQH